MPLKVKEVKSFYFTSRHICVAERFDTLKLMTGFFYCKVVEGTKAKRFDK